MATTAATFPGDVDEKMTKKIAQLTKVIYQLNTQNEDHQVEKDALVAAHAAELAGVVADTQGKLDELAKQLAERKEHANLEAQLEQLTAKHASEKAACLAEVAAYKRAVQGRADAAATDFENCLQALRDDVSRAQASAAVQVCAFEEALRANEASRKEAADANAAALKALRQEHVETLAENMRAAAAKEAATVAELQRAAEEAAATARATLAIELETQGQQHEQQLGKLRAELAADAQAASLAAAREHEQAMATARAQHEEALSHATEREAAQQKALSKANEEIVALEQRLKATVAERDEAKQLCERLRRDIEGKVCKFIVFIRVYAEFTSATE